MSFTYFFLWVQARKLVHFVSTKPTTRLHVKEKNRLLAFISVEVTFDAPITYILRRTAFNCFREAEIRTALKIIIAVNTVVRPVMFIEETTVAS